MTQKRIFALGGGYYGEHKDTYPDIDPEDGTEYFPWDTQVVDERIVAATGKKKPQALALTTPSEDGCHDVRLLYEAFERRFTALGCQTSLLKLIEARPSGAEIEVAITAADIVFVTGGNTYRAMRRWRQLGVDRLLRVAYERGAVMSGLSAGAICWFSWGNSNSFYTDKPFRVKGLGWLPALLCPHYDSEPFRQEPFKRQIKRTPGLVGLALDEGAALEILNDREYRVHAYRPGAKVRKCYWQSREYVIEEIEPQVASGLIGNLLSW